MSVNLNIILIRVVLCNCRIVECVGELSKIAIIWILEYSKVVWAEFKLKIKINHRIFWVGRNSHRPSSPTLK